jgi:hypothetical protein
MFAPASPFLTVAFIALSLLVALAFLLACDRAGRQLGEPAGLRRRRALLAAAAVAAWLLFTGAVAASGVLREDVMPPPFAGLVLAVAAIGVGLPFSRLGTLLAGSLPLWALVGFQVFRLPLELLLHQAYAEGVLPVQMTYAGQNFDIVTGITAGLLGAWLLRAPAPRWVISAWNVMGLLLLVNIVAIAIVSAPLFAWFGPDQVNTFVTYPPFVWLPAVLVVAALAGHLLVWRRLSMDSVAAAAVHPQLS